MAIPETTLVREYEKFRESGTLPGKTVVAITADEPLPISISNVTIDNASLFVQLTAEDDDPNPGDIHDSVRIGDGTTELGITVSNEAKVSDATTHTTLTAIEVDTTSIDSKLNTLGQKTMAGSVPVVLPSDQTVPISAVSLPLPSGAATEAKQDTGNASLSSIDGKIANNYGVSSGAVRTASQIGNLSGAADFGAGITTAQTIRAVLPTDQSAIPASQSGTWNINNVTGTVSLPTGASTSALQTTGNSSLSSIDGKVANNYGVSTGAIRTASQIGNTAGGADFGSGLTTSQTLRVVLPTDQPPVQITSGFGAAFTFGDISTSATTRVPLRRTTYTEQSTNAQRSIASSSANDTAAGTGARTVTITYLTATGTGPFTETVTLNGVTFVNTVATNICFIERIVVTTVGSTLSNVGTLTLRAAAAGGGVIVATINPTDNQTLLAQHYVPVGKTANVTGISCGHNGTTVGSGALFTLNKLILPVANFPDIQVSDFVRLYGQSSTFARTYASPIKVVGPARILVYLTPETSSAITYRCSFDYFEP